MTSFVFDLPTRIVFGAGSIDAVGTEVASCGRRALLVTGSAFALKSGLIERIQRSLRSEGVEVTLYDGMEQNPDVSALDRGGELARESNADVVIGLGGGGTLDAAKAVALAAKSQESVWRYTEGAPIDAALPLVLLPMIASTGSETNSTAVLYRADEATRVPVTSTHLYAKVALVDPTLTFTVPARYTAVGAINIVSQMLESYLTSDEFAVTDRITEGLVRVVMDSLSRAMRHAEDLDARSNLSWAATLASTVATAGRGGSTPLRAMAYPLTARYSIEHGQALAALWPSYMRYALSNRLRLPQIGRFKRYALLGRQLFGVHETDDEVAAETASYRFTSWLKSMDMPTSLRGTAVDLDELRDVATQAVAISGNGKRIPGGLTIDDIEHIYEGALRT